MNAWFDERLVEEGCMWREVGGEAEMRKRRDRGDGREVEEGYR